MRLTLQKIRVPGLSAGEDRKILFSVI